MSLAKPLAGGLPIGAVLLKQKVADVMKPGVWWCVCVWGGGVLCLCVWWCLGGGGGAGGRRAEDVWS
jgi:hypothetical protein